jgi:hypothetical protein
MKLENEFTVDAPVDEAWGVMLDLERVTPCLPGGLTYRTGRRRVQGQDEGSARVGKARVQQTYSFLGGWPNLVERYAAGVGGDTSNPVCALSAADPIGMGVEIGKRFGPRVATELTSYNDESRKEYN